MIIDENSRIRDLTAGRYSTLKYNSSKDNYSGPLVKAIVDMIAKTGCDVTNTQVSAVGSTFKNIILNYQRKFKLKETGVVDDNLLHDIYNRSIKTMNDNIEPNNNIDNQQNDTDNDDLDVYDAHYDPFFLNKSKKVYRKNHKDIVISFGNGANVKRIKDVFMRSVSVQVDTSGNPISEIYSFIARDIKESDAPEDTNKYVGEEKELSASSDIKYSFDSLFKDD